MVRGSNKGGHFSSSCEELTSCCRARWLILRNDFNHDFTQDELRAWGLDEQRGRDDRAEFIKQYELTSEVVRSCSGVEQV